MYESAWTTRTKYHRQMAETTEIYFPTVLEAGGPRSWSQQGQVLVRVLYMTHRQPPACCFSHGFSLMSLHGKSDRLVGYSLPMV